MSTPEDKINKPSYKCAAYEAMSPAWTIVRDVVGGTATVRAAKTTYLQQEPAEKDNNYKRRLDRSVFFNAYRRTRESLVGLVFKTDPELDEEDVPEEIRNHAENIDLAGTHIDVFAKEVFTNAFDGHAFILVDMQPKLEEGATLADELATGRRPFWVKYKADQAVNWRTTQINGEVVLSQITFEEKTLEADGQYGEKEVCRYRVFKLDGTVTWELYKKEKGENGEDKFVPDGSGEVTTKRIPVAVVYGHKTGRLTSMPPLLDLAYLNIAHYQEYSDYRNILHVANVPILMRKGCPVDKQEMEVGPNSIQDVPIDGDIAYVEHQGHAIGAAQTELVDLEQRMAMSGLSILAQRSDSNLTATEINSNNMERTSELATMARSLQDALEQCLMFHAEYMGLDTGGSVVLGVSEEELTLDSQTLNVLLTAVTTGKLSLETWLAILQTKFPDIDLEDEASKINVGTGTVAGVLGTAPAPIRSLFQPKKNGNQATA